MQNDHPFLRSFINFSDAFKHESVLLQAEKKDVTPFLFFLSKKKEKKKERFYDYPNQMQSDNIKKTSK